MSNNPLEPGQAIAKILEPFKRGEAIRHGWLGDSGMGKTFANVRLIDLMLRGRLVRMVITLDDKTPRGTPYIGAERATIADVIDDYPSDDRHIIVRGIAMNRQEEDDVDPGAVAQFAWDIVRAKDIDVAVNIDELADATPGQGQAWKKSSMPIARAFRKGRGAGVSVLWTTQIPQSLPLEAFGLSSTMGIFRLDGREVDYLRRKNVLEAKVAEIVPSLGIGEFIIYAKGGEGWDGNIYQFPKKKRKGD